MNLFVAPPGSPAPGPAGVPRAASLAEAVALAPPDGSRPFVIGLAPGVYREKLTVDRPHVVLLGPPLGPEGPVARLVWGDWAGRPDPAGQPLGTFRSQTLAVLAPDFRAERLTVANDWDYPASQGAGGRQAVALKTDAQADRTVLIDCALEGHQDTLYVNAGRHWLLRCRISGHVDFIFGAGRTVFRQCRLVCLARPQRPDPADPEGYVCAPSTRAPHRLGFVFDACRVEKGQPAPAVASFALGRPWHPSFAPDTVNAAVFKDCWLDDHIRDQAWTSMDSRPGGVRTTYLPDDARLFEYRSTGPGAAGPGPGRFLLGREEGEAVTDEAVLGDWRPSPLTPSPQ